jgi:hypothetical protein
VTIRAVNTHDVGCVSCVQLTGIPVFSAPAGDLAYVVTQLQSSQAVDFSADGELLAIAGGIGVRGEFSDSDRVMLLQASDGAVIADTVFNDEYVFAVAIDPYRPLVYVGVVKAGATLDAGLALHASASGGVAPTLSSRCAPLRER